MNPSQDMIENRIKQLAGGYCEDEMSFLTKLLDEVQGQPCWEELDHSCLFIEASSRLGVVRLNIPDPYGEIIRQLKVHIKNRK